MSAIVLTIITVFLVVLVVRLVNRILRARSEKQETTEADDYIMDEVVELERPRRERISFRARTNDEQVRLKYKKEIFKKRKENKLYENVRKHLTPSQIEDESVFNYGENVPDNSDYWDKLHNLYEKARYSREECTAQDVNALKKPGR